ncbi:Uncharacterised protein [uncultured Clostridium sp.]|uniref:DUF6483 family protein n=1 Tax=uncultured Clostridium sp. TaxID=59620 RepID=UPI00082211D2|nr:DUF6483 family protein [uncultured Clostridium sp.]SCJ61399.1 Uncharacterised protein [uncultured Clostridium sp.]
MFKNDYILDMVESLGKNIGKSLTGKKEDGEKISIENLSDKDMLMIILKKMVIDKKYNEAENTLFEIVNKIKDIDFTEVGEWFYNELSLKKDEDLLENNFLRDEIKQGLKDFRAINSRRRG